MTRHSSQGITFFLRDFTETFALSQELCQLGQGLILSTGLIRNMIMEERR